MKREEESNATFTTACNSGSSQSVSTSSAPGRGSRITSTTPPKTSRESATTVAALLDDVRELSRGLHPALLSRAGLRAALEALARKSPIPVEMDVALTARPPPAIETALYYIVSEALANAAKHSKASTIMIAVNRVEAPEPAPDGRHARDVVRARITDDGIGGVKPANASGLVGMADRVEALGGRFSLDSQTGHGTTIVVEFPFASEERQPLLPQASTTG